MSSSSNVAPVQRSRKFDSTAPVVPSKYLMNSEPRLSNFDAPPAASQRLQELKAIPQDILSGMPILSRDKDFESMKEESAGRSADERESISNEMCKMLQTHVSSVLQTAYKVNNILRDDLDHSNPISHTKSLDFYAPKRSDDSKLEYYSKKKRRSPRNTCSPASGGDLRIRNPNMNSPTARRIALEISSRDLQMEYNNGDGKGGHGSTKKAKKKRRSTMVQLPAEHRLDPYVYNEKRYLNLNLIRSLKRQLHEYAKDNILRQADEVVYYLRSQAIDQNEFFKPKYFYTAKPLPPFLNQEQGNLLCQYAAACIRVPCADPKWKFINMSGGEDARKNLTSAMSMQCSVRVMVDLFWYCHMRRFQKMRDGYGQVLPERKEALRILTRRISKNYAMLVSGVKVKKKDMSISLKDFVFRFLPFAISHAVVCCFYYFCPASRNVFVKLNWQHGVWLDVCGILSGVSITPSTISVMRSKLFTNDEAEKPDAEDNDEVDDDPDAGRNQKHVAPLPTSSLGFTDIGLTGASRARVSKSKDLKGKFFFFTGFSGNNFKDSHDENDLREERKRVKADILSRGGLIASSLKKANAIIRRDSNFVNGIVERAQASEDIAVFTLNDIKKTLYDIKVKTGHRLQSREKLRGKQPRVRFQGGHISPWCSELFGSDSVHGTKSVNLLRTVPVENCLSGGQNTYHPVGMDDVTPIIEKMQNTISDNREKYKHEVREMRKSLRNELNVLDGRTHEVLYKGGSQRAKAFCFDLRQRKIEEQQRKLNEEKERLRQEMVKEANLKMAARKHRPVKRKGNGAKKWAEQEGLVWNLLPLH